MISVWIFASYWNMFEISSWRYNTKHYISIILNIISPWSHIDNSSLRVVDIFHLSVAEMPGLGVSLVVWSYLPVFSSFYFSISSMNTWASFIRTTNNEVPLTISLSPVSTKSMKKIFFVPKEMLNHIKRFLWAELL